MTLEVVRLARHMVFFGFYDFKQLLQLAQRLLNILEADAICAGSGDAAQIAVLSNPESGERQFVCSVRCVGHALPHGHRGCSLDWLFHRRSCMVLSRHFHWTMSLTAMITGVASGAAHRC